MAESTQRSSSRRGAASTRPRRGARTLVDAGDEPLGRITSNFPVWIAAAVFAAFAIAALVSGSEWIALGLAIVTVFVAVAATMNAGHAARRQLEGQPTTRQFGIPFALLAAGVAIAALIGVLVIVS